jgi:AraC-like DNA-binding protein
MYPNIPRYRPDKALNPMGIEIYPIEILHNKEIARSAIYDYHRASFYHIIRYRGTNNFHYIANKKIKLEHHNLLIVNRDIAQRFPLSKCEGDLIAFSASFFGSNQQKADYLNRSLLFQDAFTIVKPQSNKVLNLTDTYFSLMKHQYGQGREIQLSLLRNWLHNLLMVIEREYGKQSKLLALPNGQRCLQQFKSLLDTSYCVQKQVSYYAGALDISERKLSRLVFAVYGITAKEYIAERVLSEAMRLLKNTTLNQGEIANRLGLDLTYFIKFFRRRIGQTPARYRRLNENVFINKYHLP